MAAKLVMEGEKESEHERQPDKNSWKPAQSSSYPACCRLNQNKYADQWCLQIREGVRWCPGCLRATTQPEQRFRLRSGAITKCHHCCSSRSAPSQRLSNCRQSVRGCVCCFRQLACVALLTHATAIKAKVENKQQYEEYLKELEPLREELGITLREILYPEM